MKSAKLGWTGLLLLLCATSVAAAAAPPAATPAPVPKVDEMVSGTFTWEGVTLDYSGGTSEGGQRVTAVITAADGTVLAESEVTPDAAVATVAGVEVTSEAEISDEQAAVVAEFGKTDEAAAIRALASALAGARPVEQRAPVLGFIAIALTLGEGAGVPQLAIGDCFGCCGPGCWGCWLLGKCYTLACVAHDACVAALGHTHPLCLKLLLVAIKSYLKECLGLAVAAAG